MAEQKPSQLLTAVIDVESKKTPEEKAAEAKINAHPEHAAMIVERACQKKSLQVVEEVMRYLLTEDNADMSGVVVWCGHRVEEHRWEIFVAFCKEELSKEKRVEARDKVLSLLGDGSSIEPEADLQFKDRKDIPNQLFERWFQDKGWEHLSAVQVHEKQLFVPVRDGEGDDCEIKRYLDATEASEKAGLASRLLVKFNQAFFQVVRPVATSQARKEDSSWRWMRQWRS